MNKIAPAPPRILALAKELALIPIAGLLLASGLQFAGAAQTDIATVPVMNITGTGSIKPNIMLMLDDSGSMAWDFVPDQVDEGTSGADSQGKCFTASGLASCTNPYQPPFAAQDFNFIYYSPTITYTPGVDYTGASLGAQTTFTAVKSNPYVSTSTTNLVTGYPDAYFCTVTSPTTAQKADPTVCRKNINYSVTSPPAGPAPTFSYTSSLYSAYNYPDPTGGTFVNQVTTTGNSYYYFIVITKYCSDANLTTCISATAPTGSYTYPAPVRWCTSATTNYAYTACQRNYDSTHLIPEFIGTVHPASPSAAAYVQVDVTTANSQYSITGMQVAGVDIIPSGTTLSASSAANFATALATAINGYHSTPEYAACVGIRSADNTCNSTGHTTSVTIFPQTASCGTSSVPANGVAISGCTAQVGSANNGLLINTPVPGPNSAGVAANNGTITVGSDAAGSVTHKLAAVTVNAGNISSGTITFTGNLGNSVDRQSAAQAIATNITAANLGYSASAAGGVVTLTATTAGTGGNGTVAVTSGATGAVGTITVGSITSGTTYGLDGISNGSTQIVGPFTASSSAGSASSRQSAIATAIANAVNADPFGLGYTATSSGAVVTINAPTALGTAGNGTLSTATPTAKIATGTATLTVGTNAAPGVFKITSISMGATTVASNVSCPGGTTTAVAICVRDAINAAGTNFAATASGAVVTITATQSGTYANGTLSVTVPTAVKPTATLTVNSASSAVVTALKVSTGGSCTTSITSTPGILSGSTNSSSTINTVASRIAANVASGYSGSSSSAVVTVTAPNSTLTGCTLSATASGTFTSTGTAFGAGSDPMTVTAAGSLSGGAAAATLLPISATGNFSGGANTIPTTTVDLTNGANPSLTAVLSSNYTFGNGVSGNATPVRMNVGTFTRTDIVPCAGGAADTCYPVASTRTDCASTAGCTYNEEMTNFANWYAYYRTRTQTMKSASGLAFNSLGGSYRVGFAKLSNVGYGGAVDLLPSDFNATQRASWYSKLYASVPGVSTPLRTALDALGKMYANQSPYNYTGSNMVVQYPCQQNFVIITTDGLWNQNYTGSVGNNDNVENTSRFCTKASGCFDGITSSPTVPSLADVALYWYNGGSNTSTVSLRPDLETDMTKPGVVPAGPADPNTHLHMTTFTLGLGVNGFMRYEDHYDTAPSTGGDYYNLITGASGCPWNGGGTFVWPNPVANDLTAVDDLWHAAVNGHGKYFSARSPAAVVSGLSAAIAAMAVRTGAASAAATSTPNVSQQDNDIFSATFTTVKWYGELFDQKIDTTTGNVSSAINWSSSDKLGTQVSSATDTRNIYMLDASGTTPALKNFSYSAMTSTEKAWFDNKATGMVQYSSLSGADQTVAKAGNNLVNWLRGQTQYADDQIYRAFTSTTASVPVPIVLGDIDTAKPAYVRDPRKGYAGSYTSFISAYKSRAPTVFAAANDGMLHAFNAANGLERWAYAPRITMSKLWHQAATDYGSNHQFTVDGSPEIADVQISANCGTATAPCWRTVMVGGLNAGGRGYYALDVTDPTSPYVLWEFCADSTICAKSDPDIGLTFGNAQFGYWNNKWVVLVTSGYNNISGTDNINTGSGIGYLYILDVQTGTVLKKISTGVGDTITPSGFSRITAITNNPLSDPNITYVYGGDNQGNLFRFDFTDPTFATIPKVTLATLGSGQPITTRPDVALCQAGAGLQKVVLLGTGRLLGLSDVGTTGTQSVYLIKDTGTALGNVRGAASLVQQTLQTVAGSGGTLFSLVNKSGTSAPPPVNLATGSGWYVDLTLNTGERVNLDPKIVFSTAVVVSNLPLSGSACTVGGTSFNYQFDLCSGSYVPGTTTVGGVLSNTSAAVGFIVIKLPSGVIKMITTTADGSKLTSSVKASASSSPRKSGWRSVRN